MDTTDKAHAEAQHRGLRFFVGKTCPKCNTSKRYTTSKGCVRCQTLRNAIKAGNYDPTNYMVKNDRLREILDAKRDPYYDF